MTDLEYLEQLKEELLSVGYVSMSNPELAKDLREYVFSQGHKVLILRFDLEQLVLLPQGKQAVSEILLNRTEKLLEEVDVINNALQKLNRLF